MKWSKPKSRVEDRFAPSVRKRVAIFSTRFGGCTCGRAWITVDGEEVANFCTRAKRNADAGVPTPPTRPLGHGELSRQDAYAACWAFVHDLSVEQSLTDEDPLVQALAVLDARLGKRRLAGLEWQALHPLTRSLLAVRLEAESLPVPVDLGR